MKQILFALALAASPLAANATTVTDKVEDAIAEAIKKIPDMVENIASDAIAAQDSATSITLYSDTTDEELADDTTMTTVVNTQPTNYKFSYSSDEDDPWIFAVAIVAIVCVIVIPLLCLFAFPLLIIWLIARSRRKRERERNEMIMALAKEGKDVTPIVNNEIAADRKPAATNEDMRNKGIKNVCIGFGVGVLLWSIMGKLGFGIGFIIVCVGFSQLLTANRAGDANNYTQANTTADSSSYNKEERSSEPTEDEKNEA
ncbi:MAG: DUF6249 domain-containing protein [Prevotellaceae bacterium]|nr:DUF6249 domain-containing protein [Prevotellaceae bacterium]